MQIQSICKRCSIILRKFAKRAQTTFGAFAKGNLLPFGMLLQKAKRLRNPRIACSTDHNSNIPLRELNLNFEKRDDI